MILALLTALSKAEDQPCTIDGARISASDKRSLNVTWRTKGECNDGVILAYRVIATHKKYLACPNLSEGFKRPEAISVDTGKTTFAKIYGLKPFSEYKVQIGKY